MSGEGHNSRITRAGLADEIDMIDESIKTLNASKSEAYKAYREQLEAAGMEPRRAAAEIAATKAAIVKRRNLRKDPSAVAEKDDLIDAILAEITRKPSRAREGAEIEGERTHLDRGQPAAPSMQGGTISNPPPSSSPAADLPEPNPPAEAKTGAEQPPSAPVEDFQPPTFLVKKHVLRPHCLEPHLCRSGTSDHCHHCKKAMAESEAA